MRISTRPVAPDALKPVLFLLACMMSAPTHADTFTVTTTADSGAGSLRQAIADANAKQMTNGFSCMGHSIRFNIPGTPPHTIQPLSPLPRFNIPITLDGYTQPDASQNSLPQGSNAAITIELDGSFVGAADAIVIGAFIPGSPLCSANGSIIRGLVINRFAGAAISMGEQACPTNSVCPVGAVVIQGNYIGTDVSGTIAKGNGGGGAALIFGTGSSNNIVGDEITLNGGPDNPSAAARNVISGNTADAIGIVSTDANSLAQNHRIRNNYIGLDANGTAVLPNGGRGVTVGVNASAIAIHENLIGGNGGDGVAVLDSPFAGTSLQGNGIGTGVDALPFGNGGNGILVAGSALGVSVSRGYPYVVTGTASIANNAGAGLRIIDSAIVDVVSASIAGNHGLAIDLGPPGVNVHHVGDSAIGPNELLNSPVVDSAKFDLLAHSGAITGSLDAGANHGYEIHFYLNDACDQGGFGGTQTVLNIGPSPLFANVTTDATGHGNFSTQTPFLPPGKFLTALTRRSATASASPALIVSEPSACRRVAAADQIYADGFD